MRLGVLVAAGLLLAGCAPRHQHAPASETAPVQVAVSGFRAADAADRAGEGEIYGTLIADAADTLLRAEVPRAIAARAEFVEPVGGVANDPTLRVLPSVHLAEHVPLELRPDGLRLALRGLTRPLHEPHTVTLRLRFARGGERVLEVPVRTP